MSRFVLLNVIVLSFSIFGFAQTPTPPPPPPPVDSGVIEINTRLIDVPVSVRDEKGAPVLKLSKTNFEVLENGKKQKIESFFTTDEPFEVALLLDTSGSTRSEIRLIRRAAQLFINSLRKGDRVSVISFKTVVEGKKGTRFAESFAEVDFVTPLTEDRKVLADGVSRLADEQRNSLLRRFA